VADVFLAAWNAALADVPRAHTDDEVRSWVAGVLIPSGGVSVAVGDDGAILAMMAIERRDGIGWLDQLYVRPDRAGRGLGGLLLDEAKRRLGPPIRLYTFQVNAGARRFYERHGFVAIAFGDGSGNEEGWPDILYEWRDPPS